MSELQWFFPETLAEVPGILAREGVRPHGGGTGLLRAGLGQTAGLMDVGRLGLDVARLEGGLGAGQERGRRGKGSAGGTLVLGAALSYAEAARRSAELLQDPAAILAQALGRAATTPLRNRITLGGSLAMFPFWSDLLGPLLALQADVRQVGAHEGSWTVQQYLEDRDLRRGSLITEIAFPAGAWKGTYHRHTRTASDHPMFTVTVLRRAGTRRVEDPRVVLTGTSGRYQRLTGLEERLHGLAPAKADPAALLEGVEPVLPARMGFSAEYLQAVARVELERALAANLREGDAA